MGIEPRFNGSDYDPKRDDPRLTTQIARVKAAIADGHWRTLAVLSEITGDPEASVSAQLRHLRKHRHGSHQIDKKLVEGTTGLYVYRLHLGAHDFEECI